MSEDRKLDYLKLNSLRITGGANCTSEKACLEGTRTHALNNIRLWIHGGGTQPDARALLLLGQAGVGKSAIAHSIAHMFKDAKRLGASFCFENDRGTENFFRTVARGIADVDPAYALALANVINSTNASTVSHLDQLTELLIRPLQSLSFIGPLVIVVDALDECKAARDLIVDVLAKNIHNFPSNIRFLITSRPSEAEILRRYHWVRVYDLEDEPAAQQDILAFVKEQLREPGSDTRLKGFRSRDLEAIAASAEGLFQYAAVVCREILNSRKIREAPTKVFKRLVKPGSSGLDSLYTLVLSNAYKIDLSGSNFDTEGIETFRSVLGWILVAHTRLTHQSLIDFGACVLSKFTDAASGSDAGSDASSEYQPEEGFDEVSNTLRPLGALLSGTQDLSATVYPLHSSVRDYLLDASRSGCFCIGSASQHHALLASASLKIMERDLHFNMIDLKSSYVPNTDIPDLQARLDAHVSVALFYACRFWYLHLKDSEFDEKTFDAVSIIHVLARQKFLFWLEVLGLQQCTYHAQKAFEYLDKWYEVRIRIMNKFYMCFMN